MKTTRILWLAAAGAVLLWTRTAGAAAGGAGPGGARPGGAGPGGARPGGAALLCDQVRLEALPQEVATWRARKESGCSDSLVKEVDQLALSCTAASQKEQIEDLKRLLCMKPDYPCVLAKGQRLVVSLDRMPTARVKLNVDDQNKGRHLEAEWDPNQSGPLVKGLTLPSDGAWQFSLWREPSADPKVQPVQQDLPVPACWLISASASIQTFAFKDTGESLFLRLKKTPMPSLADLREGLHQGSYGESGVRGLDASVPAAAQDLFRIFAQIAYERASSKAMEVLSGVVVKFVCELKLPKGRANQLGLTAAEQDVAVLPATCQVVKGLRIQELGSTAHALLQALLTDVAELTTSIVLAQLDAIAQNESSSQLCGQSGLMCRVLRGTAMAVRPVFRNTLPILIEAAAERRQLTTRDANLVLVQLSQIDWTQALKRPGEDPEGSAAVSCGFQLGFAILSECQQKGGCDAREIAERVATPAHFYTLGDCSDGLGKLSDYFPDLGQFVSRGLEIVFPAKGVDARATIRNAANLIFDVTERLQCAIAADRKSQIRQACKSSEAFGLLIKDLRQITAGLIDRDAIPVMLGVTAILQRALPDPDKKTAWTTEDKNLNVALVKAGQVLTALSAYAATYTTAGDAKSIEAQQAARKKAIESLIDSATKRAGRDGAWVVSLGANVGFSGGLQWIRAQSGCQDAAHPCGMVPQLSLPMGLALQYLPDLRRKRETADAAHRRSLDGGFHLQLSPIDLSQFIALDGSLKTTDNFRWSDFVMVGLQFGAIVGKPDVNFLIVADLRWLPTVFSATDNSTAGAFRVGVTLSYYVPFFDFN